MNRKIAFKLLVISSVIAVVLLLPQVTTVAISHPLRLVLIFILVIQVTTLFKKLFIDCDRKPWVKNAATGIFSAVIFLLMLEMVFMFIPRTHATAYTLGVKLWFSKYWNPINAYGYRDDEPENSNKANVFFIGDSFTFGAGIKKTKDRFSNIVEQKFLERNNPLNVINLGVNGADTKREYESMIKFIESSGIQPDFLVLQYLGNDIDVVAKKKGLKINATTPYHELNFFVRKVVQGSYLLDYLYWLLPKSQNNGYINFVNEAYSNDSIFYQHTRDLKLFIDYANNKKIPLLVVVFPFMQIVELSNKLYLNKIKHFLDENSANYLDISPLIKNLSLKDRVVNSNDAHPSKKVNRLVGNGVYDKISNIDLSNN